MIKRFKTKLARPSRNRFQKVPTLHHTKQIMVSKTQNNTIIQTSKRSGLHWCDAIALSSMVTAVPVSQMSDCCDFTKILQNPVPGHDELIEN